MAHSILHVDQIFYLAAKVSRSQLLQHGAGRHDLCAFPCKLPLGEAYPQHRYSWERACEAYECVQMSLYQDDQRRQKWERLDAIVDEVRNRYGYMSLQRALIYTDPLGKINPKDDHTVHPVGYFVG